MIVSGILEQVLGSNEELDAYGEGRVIGINRILSVSYKMRNVFPVIMLLAFFRLLNLMIADLKLLDSANSFSLQTVLSCQFAMDLCLFKYIAIYLFYIFIYLSYCAYRDHLSYIHLSSNKTVFRNF